MLAALDSTQPKPRSASQEVDRLLSEAEQLYEVDATETGRLAALALAQAQDASYARGRAQALYWLGRAEASGGDFDRAFEHLAAGMMLARGERFKRLRAEFEDALAYCHAQSGASHAGLRHWFKSIESAIHLEAVDIVTDACIGIGGIFFSLDDYLTAFDFHEQAVEFAELQPDRRLRCKAYIYLAADLIKLKEYRLAFDTLKLAQSWLTLPEQRNWEAEILNYFGAIAVCEADYPAAERYFAQAEVIAEEIGFTWGQAMNLLEVGKLHLLRGNDAAAEVALLKAQAVTEFFDPTHFLHQVHFALAELYEQRGDFEKAFRHHVAYHQHHTKARQDGEQIPSALAINERRLNQIKNKLRLIESEVEIMQLKRKGREQGRLVEELESVALHDALTGIFNRRAFDLRLAEAHSAAQSAHAPLALLMIDFDHFKQINDKHSHVVGDKVLQSGAGLLLEACRRHDVLARYGGEEFALILPGSKAEIAQVVAERVRQAFVEHNWRQIEQGLSQVTVSIGVGVLEEGETVPSLIARADAALYEAKRTGRNRVCLARWLQGGSR